MSVQPDAGAVLAAHRQVSLLAQCFLQLLFVHPSNSPSLLCPPWSYGDQLWPHQLLGPMVSVPTLSSGLHHCISGDFQSPEPLLVATVTASLQHHVVIWFLVAPPCNSRVLWFLSYSCLVCWCVATSCRTSASGTFMFPGRRIVGTTSPTVMEQQP